MKSKPHPVVTSNQHAYKADTKSSQWFIIYLSPKAMGPQLFREIVAIFMTTVVEIACTVQCSK